MSRGRHRAPSRLPRFLGQPSAQRFLVRFLVGAIVIIVLVGVFRAIAESRSTSGPEPTAPVISAPPTSTPRVIR